MFERLRIRIRFTYNEEYRERDFIAARVGVLYFTYIIYIYKRRPAYNGNNNNNTAFGGQKLSSDNIIVVFVAPFIGARGYAAVSKTITNFE